MARRAVVGHHDVPHLLHALATAHEKDRRQSQAFLKHLGRGRCERTDHHAADLGEMGNDRRIGDEFAVVVDRLDHQMLGHMTAAPVGVVVDHHVAWRKNAATEFLKQAFDGIDDRSELRGAIFALRQQLPVAVEQRARKITRLVEDRRISGAHHRGAHLAADVHQGVVDDAQRHRLSWAARHEGAGAALHDERAVGGDAALDSLWNERDSVIAFDDRWPDQNAARDSASRR